MVVLQNKLQMCHVCHLINEEHTISRLLQKLSFQINPPRSAGITSAFAGLQSRSLHPTYAPAPWALALDLQQSFKMEETLIQSLFVPEGIQASLHSLKSAQTTSFKMIIWRLGKLCASHIDIIFNGLSYSPSQALLFPLLPDLPCVCAFIFLLLPNLLPIHCPWNIFLSPCLRDHGHHRSISIWAPLSLVWTASHNQKKQLQSPSQSCYFWMEDATSLCRAGLNWYFFPQNKPIFPGVNKPLNPWFLSGHSLCLITCLRSALAHCRCTWGGRGVCTVGSSNVPALPLRRWLPPWHIPLT